MKRLSVIISAFVTAALAVPIITAVSFTPQIDLQGKPQTNAPVIDAIQSDYIFSQNGDYPKDEVSAYIVEDEKPPEVEEPDFSLDYFEDGEQYLGANTQAEASVPDTGSAETEAATAIPETTAEETIPETTVPETTVPETTAPTLLRKGEKFLGCDCDIVRVYDHEANKYIEMQLGEYLFGVVAAEMPAYFELDALMAQAVACRTFSLYRMENNSTRDSSYHGDSGADVCTYSGHCQAYIGYDEAVGNWGKEYADSIFDKVKEAVLKTSGIVATYGGELIDAVYHSCSYKMTDSHVNVWTADYPYLVGVSTPEDESFSIGISTVSYSSSRMGKIIRNFNRNAVLEEDPALWLDDFSLNDCGRIDSYTIGNTEFSGNKMRSVFELRSTNFKIRYDKESDRFVFTVFGWGHGVGLSQYGANIYAKQGYDYAYILNHYYTGIELKAY